jgi:hypothetical protein
MQTWLADTSQNTHGTKLVIHSHLIKSRLKIAPQALHNYDLIWLAKPALRVQVLARCIVRLAPLSWLEPESCLTGCASPEHFVSCVRLLAVWYADCHFACDFSSRLKCFGGRVLHRLWFF